MRQELNMWQEFQTKSFVGVARAHPGFEPGIKDSHAQCRASFASGVVCIHHNSSGAPFLGARRCWFTDCGDELLRSHEGRSFRSWWRLIGMRHAPLGEISGGCLASPAPPTQWTRRLSQPTQRTRRLYQAGHATADVSRPAPPTSPGQGSFP